MKKYIAVLVVLAFLSQFLGCGPSIEELSNQRATQAKQQNLLHDWFSLNPSDFREGEYIIQIIDSCEYITGWSGGYHGGPLGMHKGNCKFCKIRLDAKLDTMLARFYRQLKHK